MPWFFKIILYCVLVSDNKKQRRCKMHNIIPIQALAQSKFLNNEKVRLSCLKTTTLQIFTSIKQLISYYVVIENTDDNQYIFYHE